MLYSWASWGGWCCTWLGCLTLRVYRECPTVRRPQSRTRTHIEFCRNQFMHSSLRVPPQHFGVVVWTLIGPRQHLYLFIYLFCFRFTAALEVILQIHTSIHTNHYIWLSNTVLYKGVHGQLAAQVLWVWNKPKSLHVHTCAWQLVWGVYADMLFIFSTLDSSIQNTFF